MKKISKIIYFSLIAFLFGCYIYQVYFYNLHLKNLADLQKKIAQLSQTNKELQLKITSFNDLTSLDSLASFLNFEEISKINYLKIPKRSLAAK